MRLGRAGAGAEPALAVGLGMIPRGEVGLIFAGVGLGLTLPRGEPVVDFGTFSSVVVMIMLTTVVTPPLLKWSLSRNSPPGSPPPPPVSERAPPLG